jgi:hypothetical protein
VEWTQVTSIEIHIYGNKCSCKFRHIISVFIKWWFNLSLQMQAYSHVYVCDCRRGLDWILDLMTNYTHDSEPQVIRAPTLVSTVHKSAPAKSFPACCVFTSRSLVTATNSGDSLASAFTFSLNGGSFPTLATDSFLQNPVQNWLGYPNVLPCNSSARPTQTTPFILVCVCYRGNAFTEPFPSSGRLFLLIKDMLPSNGRRFVVSIAVAT